MNWAWAASLDHIWRSPSFPMWLTLSAAAFFGIIVFLMLLRTDQSVASGALAIITLLSLGIAVASMVRGHETLARTASAESRSQTITPGLAALSCVDDLAGDTVGQACERAVFGSPESTAAAVNYAASMLTRLVALGDATSAQRTMSPEAQAMRRAIERDRYGLIAHVLLARERCTPTQCAAYRSLTDNHQIITNMDEHAFDNLVVRYAGSWNAPQITSGTTPPLAMLPASMPTGRPTNAEFPSSANTPAVSIMSPEPGTGTKPAVAQTTVPARPPQTAAAPTPSAPAPPAAAKKQAVTKRPPATPPSAPTLISPPVQAPAASDD
jgi:hypothetical protein